MRKAVVVFAAILVVGALNLAAQKAETFTGEIMDSECAGMGSHAMMLKGHGMAGKENDAAAKKMCTLDCVKAGGKYVLYDAAKKAVYQLDDQKKPEQFAGMGVKVTGTLDAKSSTIHVVSIAKGS